MTYEVKGPLSSKRTTWRGVSRSRLSKRGGKKKWNAPVICRSGAVKSKNAKGTGDVFLSEKSHSCTVGGRKGITTTGKGRETRATGVSPGEGKKKKLEGAGGRGGE